MKSLEVLRVDDLPLLYAQIEELGIQRVIDSHIHPHGNRQNLSLGHLVSLWMCYLLSESDHRLSAVESWSESNLHLLRFLSGQRELTSKDFTDDRLGQALDYLSKGESFERINNEISFSSIEIYDLSEPVSTIRLDAAPMQGHHQVKKDQGLFQYGYGKHHDSRLGMLKIMLACLDHELSGFSYPLSHMILPGNQADDISYIPMINQCNALFAGTDHSGSKLYIGDSKMGSKQIRCHIFKNGHYYLVPLSKIQFSDAQRKDAISQMPKESYIKIYKQDQEECAENIVAEGFEKTYQVTYEFQDQTHTWDERRIFVLSQAYHQSQCKALDTKLDKAIEELSQLLVIKKGKVTPKTPEQLNQAITKILKANAVEGLVDVHIQTQEHQKQIRAYKDRPARSETYYTFELECMLNQQKIQAHKATLGWQVYATQIDKEHLSFEACVWKYRQQNRIESRFNDIRNKVVPLVPIFVKKDNRVEALINLLMLCLKTYSAMEYKVEKALKESKQKLANIFEGNPKKQTQSPTAKRMLKQFMVSMVIVADKNNTIPDIRVTKITPTQQKIIQLLGFEQDIYSKLDQKIKIFFAKYKISEN